MPTFFDSKHHEPPLGEHGRARLRRDDGFTLIELIVVMALSTVVLGAMLTFLYTSQQVQAGDAEWAQVMQAGRVGLSRMTREIRQASKIEKAEAGTIEFLATIGGTEWKIKYECATEQTGIPYKSYYECKRFAVEKSTGTLPSKGTTIMRDVLNPTEVFKYFKGATEKTNPEEMNVVTLKIKLPPTGTLKQADFKGHANTVVLENAAYMRNCNIEEAGKAKVC